MRTRFVGHAATLTDLLMVVAMLALVGLVVVPHIAAATREEENRIQCANNLKQISMAMMLYSNAEPRTNAYPRTRFDMKTADKPVMFTNASANKPFADNGPAVNDVTAAIWLLLRTQDVTGDIFVCPSAGNKPFVVPPVGKVATDFSNFQSAATLSYSMQNPYPTKDAVDRGFAFNSSMPADCPLLADINPGSADVAKAKPTDSAAMLQKANSPNHGFYGQNIVYADGHVDWSTSVFAGRSMNAQQTADNIYTYRSADAVGKLLDVSADVIGPPGGPDDAVLLPVWDDKMPFPKIDLTAAGSIRDLPGTRPAH